MRSETEIRNALEQLILGELPATDAARLASEAGYRTFADLCEAQLPERLPKVRIDRGLVRRRIAQAVSGRLALDELRAWAEELSAVLERHELGASVLERGRLNEALALTAVATDARIFKNRRPVLRVLQAIVRALGRRHGGGVAHLYGALFQGQPEFHLLARRLDDIEAEEEPELDGPPPSFLPQTPSFSENLGLEGLELDMGLDRSWSPEAELEAGEEQKATEEGIRCADVVALNRPFEPGSRVQDYEWVVAFSVATRLLVEEDSSISSTPVEGFLERVSELAPNFDLRRYRPEARRDPDGVLELILDAPTIGRNELVYAVKLFALTHQVGTVWFEGRRLNTIAPPR